MRFWCKILLTGTQGASKKRTSVFLCWRRGVARQVVEFIRGPSPFFALKWELLSPMLNQPDLPTHALLTSKGWEWITNCGKADSDEVLHSFRSTNGDSQYRLGEPHSPHVSTVQLIAMSMVGVYRKQEGGRPVKLTFDHPILPSFSTSPTVEEPQQPRNPVQPNHGKPLEVYTCGA